MKPIRILSHALELLAEIDDYESLQFYRRWHKVGEFELNVNRNKQNTNELTKGNIILLGGDLQKAGIIRHKEINLGRDGKGGETVTVSGPCMKGLAQQRITIPPEQQAYDTITGDAETVIKHYIENNVTDPADNDRKVGTVSIALNQNRGDSLAWRSRYKKLHEEIEEISKVAGLGWGAYIDLEAGEIIFEVYEGKDLTADQSENPPVIFSPEFDALEALNFMDSDIDYRNVGYAAGQGEGADREVIEIGTASGLDRHETFFDARDIDDTQELQERGEQRLAEKAQEIYLEGEVLDKSSFIYEQDYDLGDLVTVQKKEWGVTLNALITEVKETYESAGFSLDLTFGNKVPTLINKIKGDFREIENEVRR